DIHYERKEQLLFPFLEKYGFMGPSKVMWGKDNEVRDLIKKALTGIEDVVTNEALDSYVNNSLDIVLEEVNGMIFKEENILFPAALEKLNPGDWVDILKESDDIGYIFIRKPAETEEMIKALSGTLLEEPAAREGTITLPTGTFQPEELMCILNTLPFDLTFVDKDDTVRYFSEGKDRVFRRTKAVIGRKVQNCHPPQSLEVVEKIVASFKEGKKDSYDFWINLQGSLVYIRYFALRDRDGHYLGTVEVTQDIGDIKKIEGERRLIDERD
ncbi:MAG: PAS domain-containing protein, partial [Dehalococcoidia bacterium]|nr:PAS domain-containing protein [Dehalococcoidia bacterium]